MLTTSAAMNLFYQSCWLSIISSRCLCFCITLECAGMPFQPNC